MNFTSFKDSEALAISLSNHVANKLASAIKNTGKASLIVSGGNTPKSFLTKLSHQEIPWESVLVSLADERMVPIVSPRSNQAMISSFLMQNKASKATFIELLDDGLSIANEGKLKQMQPYTVVVLGMGSDGHTASIFPNCDKLVEAADLKNPSTLIKTSAPQIDEARVSQTLSALTNAKQIILHIEGNDKRAVWEEAIKSASPEKFPIKYVIDAYRYLSVYWAP